MALLRIRALLGCIFDVDQDPHFILETKAVLPSGRCINHSFHIANLQSQSGNAHKTATRPLDTLRFSVLQPIWPRIRGRDG